MTASIRSTTTDHNGRATRWAVAGHVTDAEALAAVQAYETDPPALEIFGHGHERLQDVQPYPDETWLEACEATDPGAEPVTWVMLADSAAVRAAHP